MVPDEDIRKFNRFKKNKQNLRSIPAAVDRAERIL